MARSLKGTILLVALTLVLLLALASTAFGISITSTEKQQASPGMTVRTIWGQAQVYQYPIQINHIGYAHVELTFKPSSANADLFVYGPAPWDGKSLTIPYQYYNFNQGYLGGSNSGLPVNKEYVDWYVPYVNNRLKNDAIPVHDPSGQFVGDTYYIVIVAFNETCQTQIWGYVPTIDTDYAGSADPTDALQVLKAFRFPALIWNKPAPWQTVAGTPYGQPFAFTPTSVGTEYLTLQWPADVGAKTVSTDHHDGKQPAEYESYLYGGDDWSTMLQNDFEGSRPGAASGWAPPRWDAGQGGITSPWWGYYEPLTVNDPAITPDPGWASAVAGMSQHWVTSLGLVAKSGNGPTISLPPDPGDPTVAKPTSFTDFAGPMKAGLSTIGYEATVALPQNLTIKIAAVSIKNGVSVTISGQLAYDSTGAGVTFQTGQQVKIQKKVGLNWVTVKTVTSSANGAFSAKIYPTATTNWQARCAPSPTPVSGLTIEISLTKKISVHL